MNSLSSYARMFLGVMKKPDVDSINGLCPAISIDQKSMSSNPRSTVGTTTEIYDYLRLLYARIGIAHCPECGKKIQKQSSDSIISNLLSKSLANPSIFDSSFMDLPMWNTSPSILPNLPTLFFLSIFWEYFFLTRINARWGYHVDNTRSFPFEEIFSF